MKKQEVNEILSELYDDIQEMRETGESDLRSVLNLIDYAMGKIDKL